ncbi:MAG: TrpR-like protein, YerC/YecD [Clostridia bacterium]|nr:TrpR-like protein, YerC/YecD [Clostridia bacterium]
MNSKIKDDYTDFLFDAILQLKTREECYQFFEDLCTVSEIKSMSQRIAVAKMLNDKCIYTEIVNKTGASTATISRVNRSLAYGCDAYRMVFSRMDESNEE